MDIEESDFVPENEHKEIMNEIKIIKEEISSLEAEKTQKQENIKEFENKCLTNEAELKKFMNDNEKLRKKLEENHSSSAAFLLKSSEIEKQLKKDTEKLSSAKHKVLFF